jgi:hypothetical protein
VRHAAKKADAKKKKSADDVDYNEILRTNYRKACTALGVQPSPALVSSINNKDDPTAPIVDVCTSSRSARRACAHSLPRCW